MPAPAPTEVEALAVADDDTAVDAELEDTELQDGTLFPAPAPAEDRELTLDAAVAAFHAVPPGHARIRLLGPPEVTAHGTVARNRRILSTELVAYLAAHPDGVEPHLLDGALWPDRRVSAPTRHEALSRARSWVGMSPAGSPLVSTGRHDRITLHPYVRCDWHLFQRLTDRARCAADPLPDLVAALGLVTGPPLYPLPKTRFAWVGGTFLEHDLTAAIIDTAHEAAGLLLAADRAEEAADVARLALTVDRYDERPWRDLFTAEHAQGHHRRVRDLARDLVCLLDADTYDELQAETASLLEKLLTPRVSPVRLDAARQCKRPGAGRGVGRPSPTLASTSCLHIR